MSKKLLSLMAGGFVLVVIFALVFFSNNSTEKASAPPKQETKEHGEVKEIESMIKGPGKRDDWFISQKVFPNKTLPQEAFQKATIQAKKLKEMTIKELPELKNEKWTFVGPRIVGGRIVDMAVDPNQNDTVYAAAATGGVWKSVDAGKTFTAAWDDNNTQSMGALVAAPDGTLYAGTGEANPGGGSIVFGGTGIYKSTNQGKDWESIGLTESGAIGRIAIDPHNPQQIFVAATGQLFNPGGERGLYRTQDGGKTWDLVLEGKNSTTGAVDIAIDPKNPKRIYAAMWDHVRYPNNRLYGGEGSGIYRSTDGGNTWEQLTNGLPASDKDLGRIGIAVSPTQPDRLYAITIKTDGYYEGFYISENGGDTWTKQEVTRTFSNAQSSFGWWFGRIWVDPNDEKHVFVAGVNMMESKDGGKTWTSSRGIHADQHAVVWDPKQPGRVYVGNDGGVYRSEENGLVTGKWEKATDLPATQFYTMDVSQQDITRMSGGTQDNGSIRSWGKDDWNEYYGGDGLRNLINFKDKEKVYACYQYGSCAWSEDGGNKMTYFTNQTVSDRRNWLSPLLFDPNNPSIMYYAGNRVNRSTDGGKTWEVISPSLTEGKSEDSYPYGTITTVAVSKSNGDVLYAGTDDGRLWKTTDLGKNWTEIINETLPNRWVTQLKVDAKNENYVYATFSGFRNGEDSAHVFKSEDGGKTWENISGNLPNTPVNNLIVDPKNRHKLYIATDVGIFVTKNDGKKWYSLGLGMPLAPVTDLVLHESTNTLFAATFGRGIYELKLK